MAVKAQAQLNINKLFSQLHIQKYELQGWMAGQVGGWPGGGYDLD